MRVKFETATGYSSVEQLLQYATSETKSNVPEVGTGPKLVVIGRREGASLDEGRLAHGSREDLRTCLGSLAGHFVAGGVRADLMVVQAKNPGQVS